MRKGSREIDVEDPQESKNRVPGGSGYAKEMKSACKRDTGLPTFIVALFIIVKTKAQPRCPSTGVLRKYSIHVVEYYSAMEKTESYHCLGNGWNRRISC